MSIEIFGRTKGPPRIQWASIRALCRSVIERSLDAHGVQSCHRRIIEEIVMKLDSKSGATLAV
ncbi:MAG TPA: hypothetical protein VE111_11405, partial [Bradyrhizobium sp.]|nr:hypothetical protein [Bradyrhizobium sp.]